VAIHLYLSALPEALVASLLPPDEFGPYLAVGTEKRSRGPAIYFDVDRGLPSDWFDLHDIERRCVPHADGEPKHSVYLSIYRVLERVPPEAIGDLHLATADGRVLRLAPSPAVTPFPQRFFPYREICPVNPTIVSTLDPKEFAAFITGGNDGIRIPRIVFADLRVGELADNPGTGTIRDLPYLRVEHLRDCLIELRKAPGKATKTVDRMRPADFPYRTVQNGFFLADARQMRYYPFPNWDSLQREHYEWWRSASM
jgi:hypothetical protein